MKMKIYKAATQNFSKTQTLNSERQSKPVVFSFNLQEHVRPSSNVSEEKYHSPQKGGSIDSEMEDQNSDVVVNKIKTQSIDKNKFMRTQEIKVGFTSKILKPKVLSFSGQKSSLSPQKISNFKSKAQKPVKPQKTNSNNIGQLHHSKSNSLSITHSMKMIPKNKTTSEGVGIPKKVENKKFVQF